MYGVDSKQSSDKQQQKSERKKKKEVWRNLAETLTTAHHKGEILQCEFSQANSLIGRGKKNSSEEDSDIQPL